MWKYDVNCLIEEGQYSGEDIKQAIRKSLKGNPIRIVKRLGTKATVKEIIDKLKGIYGQVEDGQSIKAEFYSAKQLPNEKIVSWSCRIEEIIDRALEQGEVQESEMDEMLRVRFWHGLQENLRDKSRHKYDQLQTFDELRTALRQIELEYNSSPWI